MSKLIQCKDCGHQVSKNANSCPNCGAKNKQTSIITWLALIFIGIPVLWSVFSGAANDTPSEPVAEVEEVSPYETMDKFEVLETDFDDYIGSRVYIVQTLVKEQMKDPESTKFRNWRYVKADSSSPATTCGEVTSKNSFNGYTGYRKFLVKMDTTEFGIERSTNGFDDLYNKLCILK